MNWINRLSRALNMFWLTFNTADGDTPLAVDALGWSDYKSRLQRYALYEAYRSNVVYRDVFKPSAARKDKYGLYKHIRGIYNPVAREVNLLGSYVYGGTLDQELRSGAIPLVTSDDALRVAVWQVFQWSKWGTQKAQFVRTGAALGDSPIKVIDDTARGRVRLELLDPRKIRDCEFDAVGNVKAIAIEYERVDPEQGSLISVNTLTGAVKTALYTEVWERIDGVVSAKTYRNGDAYGWDGNPAAWETSYGFVPVVIGGHEPADAGWNKCAFYACLDKIDEVNDSASIIGDQIRKSVVPIWVFTGTGGTPPDFSSTKKSSIPYIQLGKDATATPMVAPLQLADALQNLREILLEIERDMPELSLQRVRDKSGDTSLPAVRAQYSDAIGRIEEARGNYDDTLVRALQMAVTIGGLRRYADFRSFDVGSYDRGDLDMFVAGRPVIADELSKGEKVNALATTSAQPAAYQRLTLRELGYAADEIEDIVSAATLEKDASARAAVRGLTDSLFGGTANNADQDLEGEIVDANSAPVAGALGAGEASVEPTAD